jgi:hypothetical protein
MIYAIPRLVICFLLSILVSTLVIRLILRRFRGPESKTRDATSAISGFWIGFFETILVLVLVIEREYGALSIIFAAKQFLGLRKDVTENKRICYHLGSLINVAIAILFALVARIWMTRFIGLFLV